MHPKSRTREWPKQDRSRVPPHRLNLPWKRAAPNLGNARPIAHIRANPPIHLINLPVIVPVCAPFVPLAPRRSPSDDVCNAAESRKTSDVKLELVSGAEDLGRPAPMNAGRNASVTRPTRTGRIGTPTLR